MLSEGQLKLADEKGLIVLLHVPRRERLADPEVGRSVQNAALTYPNAKFVIAHCGRCYRYEEIRRALGWVKDLDNVWFDCSMVMDPAVLAYILQRKNPERMLFASDYPIAAMRGRRVDIGDHWVDVVLPGFPEGHYRVITDNMRATYMIHEIAKAVLTGAELAGLTDAQTRAIFFENGMKLLKGVR
jgi:predicted TIM-barrel fold metal-dependent hydrolase